MIAWVTSHRKVMIFITGVALTAAIHAWGTGNPYVSLAVLAATGLGFYQTPDQAAPAAPAARPVRAVPEPEPVAETVAGSSGPLASAQPPADGAA